MEEEIEYEEEDPQWNNKSLNSGDWIDLGDPEHYEER